jgi:GNAT superfamily N-acetyltransferase
MAYKVFSLTPDDFFQAYELWQLAITENPLSFVHGTTEDPLFPEFEGLPEFIRDSGKSFFLVQDEEGNFIGIIAVRQRANKEAWLTSYYVKSVCRGKGAGKLLLTSALQFCKENGIQTVFIGLEGSQEYEVVFFEKQGFFHANVLLEDQRYSGKRIMSFVL